MPPLIQITGMRFGKLVVVRQSKSCKNGAAWECLCDCGTLTIVSGCSLKTGNTTSCGCHRRTVLLANITTHGMANKTKTYKTWKEMRYRCNNPNSNKWDVYGGRGITICNRWSDYTNFLEDMGERPEGKTIDRIDVHGNYEPINCRWATPKEQAETNRGCFRVGKSAHNKVTQEEIAEMCRMRLNGAKLKEIAKAFNRPVSNVCTWIKHGN